MKNKISALVMATLIFIGPRSAKADLFGGDVVVLTQILAQAIQTDAQHGRGERGQNPPSQGP